MQMGELYAIFRSDRKSLALDEWHRHGRLFLSPQQATMKVRARKVWLCAYLECGETALRSRAKSERCTWPWRVAGAVNLHLHTPNTVRIH
jgi:hypothetical protein